MEPPQTATPATCRPTPAPPDVGIAADRVLEALPDPVIVISVDGRIRYANRAAEERFGWQRSEVADLAAESLVHPDDVPTAMASIASVQSKAIGTPVELRVKDRRGSYGRFEVRGRAALAEPGVSGIVLVLRDLTQRGRWEISGGDPHLLRSVIDHTPVITMLLDADGTIRGATRALTRLLGRDLESTLGRPVWELATVEEAPSLAAAIVSVASGGGVHTCESRFESRARAAPVPVSATVVNLLDDRVVRGLLMSAVDITELARARAELAHLAHHDVLTQLPNRMTALTHLHAQLHQPGAEPVTVVFCDLDDFKQINDEYGHLAGDAVLVEVARRLRRSARATDVVARFGGDEFVVVATGDHGVGPAIVARIDAAMREPVPLPGGGEVSVAVTTGHATARDANEVSTLLREADAAMYSAKRGAQPEAANRTAGRLSARPA